MISKKKAEYYVARLLEASKLAINEEQFKINAEGILKELCENQKIFWNSYTYEHAFSINNKKKFADAIHGSTIIEYESPRSFKKSENAQLKHAKDQAEEYTNFLSQEEGRALQRYSMVVWDGETISFGHFTDKYFVWEPPRSFDGHCLNRLITLIADGGRPLVSPLLLHQFIGPNTEIGRKLLPALFTAICKAQNSEKLTRTKLIYTEWSRLFGQISGVATDRLVHYMGEISRIHGMRYYDDPQAYVFALNTYIAIVSKICAVYALATQSDIVSFDSEPKKTLANIDGGEYFALFGIENMLGTDFFSWYLGNDVTVDLNEPLGLLLERLRSIDFNVSKKNPQSIRDLFKGLYMEFTPAPLRHALGEYYTPDWLASHVMDAANWSPNQTLLDPCCGSGTFILEGLRRRLEVASPADTAQDLLAGIYGFDLNPLAVLTAKASIVVFLSGRFNKSNAVLLPVFLADAINTADPNNGIFTHTILTEKGPQTFAIPVSLAESSDFFTVMNHIKICVDAGLEETDILASLHSLSPIIHGLHRNDARVLAQTVRDLISLHRNHWNGIWCLILFDRIRAGCVKNIDLVAGNPPWVKWSNLPEQYAEFVKPICDRMDIFSEDNWVGGIQSDVSTVITYHALERFVKPRGSLAFLITGTVFKNESSQGFRRWTLHLGDIAEPMTVRVVEDYGALKPFEGVSNWPTLLIISRNGKCTHYPVRYRRYLKNLSDYQDLYAMPIPGSSDGPWLVGSKSQVKLWPRLFNASESGEYRARKGVTTDLNGVYFVEAKPVDDPNLVQITNNPKLGRQKLSSKSAIVEKEDIFPLLRGRDVKRFRAAPQNSLYVIVPQRGMFGDETLPATRPRLFRYLSAFKSFLEGRSSYRRFQKGKSFWSIWSTGDYSFAPYKVVWKEMSGRSFVAAFVSSEEFFGESKTVIPDHKVYFIPLETEDEAAYLTAFLNSRLVSEAINRYASALSLGTSVTNYLNIPKFDIKNSVMIELSSMAKKFKNGKIPTEIDEVKLNNLVNSLLS